MLQATTTHHDFDQTFNRALLTLVIPIALQNLISAAVTSADIVILGMIDQTTMSAVSLAGQVTFVISLFYFGLATGAGILTAQYWGKKDFKAIQYVFNIALCFSGAISIIAFALSLLIPDVMMRLLTNDSELIHYGSIYLRMASCSYLAMGLSQVYLSISKSMENAKVSAVISSICLTLTVGFNALVVLILFPDHPESAITGVAISTVIARFIELGLCHFHSFKRGHIKFQIPKPQFIERNLLNDYLRYTLPVLGNYLIWGSAITATAAIIGHVNNDMVAANSIASAVRNLAVVFCTGIASGGAVLIGKYLGNGNQQMAKQAGNKISLYALLFGILAGGTILLIKPIVFKMVDLTPTAYNYLDGMLYICAYYSIGRSINSTIIGGIFPAGGDSKFGFWADILVMWGMILPLSYMSAFVWQLNPVWIYMIISLDEFIKIPATFIRYRQYKWVKNITREIGA
jgi:putative MATE family efflux protein